jgi:hypothetical protein
MEPDPKETAELLPESVLGAAPASGNPKLVVLQDELLSWEPDAHATWASGPLAMSARVTNAPNRLVSIRIVRVVIERTSLRLLVRAAHAVALRAH